MTKEVDVTATRGGSFQCHVHGFESIDIWTDMLPVVHRMD